MNWKHAAKRYRDLYHRQIRHEIAYRISQGQDAINATTIATTVAPLERWIDNRLKPSPLQKRLKDLYGDQSNDKPWRFDKVGGG